MTIKDTVKDMAITYGVIFGIIVVLSIPAIFQAVPILGIILTVGVIIGATKIVRHYAKNFNSD